MGGKRGRVPFARTSSPPCAHSDKRIRHDGVNNVYDVEDAEQEDLISAQSFDDIEWEEGTIEFNQAALLSEQNSSSHSSPTVDGPGDQLIITVPVPKAQQLKRQTAERKTREEREYQLLVLYLLY
jgi:hypothetical protein